VFEAMIFPTHLMVQLLRLHDIGKVVVKW
jgi:hypothetical protein